MGATAMLLLVAVALIGCLILLIVAFVRSNRIRSLDVRLTGGEAALLRLTRQPVVAQPLAAETVQPLAEEPATIVQPAGSDPTPAAKPLPPPLPNVSAPQEHLELIIGRKWLGWMPIHLLPSAMRYFINNAL